MQMMNILMIASASQDRLVSWKRELNDFVSTTLAVENLDTLGENVIQFKPKVTLLDQDLLGPDDIANLSRISAQTNIIIIGHNISEEAEWRLLKAGIRGCCKNDADPELLRQIVMTVHNGELWIRRTLTCRLIDELSKKSAPNMAYQTSLGMLNKLTQREHDIAVRVGNGDSNKIIAKTCGITERTVKAHLTEVFLKLGVSDRLNLALMLSADKRSAVRKSPIDTPIDTPEMNRSDSSGFPISY
jgi:DNA-binding NarL/FixJ family response regulator